MVMQESCNSSFVLSASSNSRDLILTSNRTCRILADIRRIRILLKTMVEVARTTYLIEKCKLFVIEIKNDKPFRIKNSMFCIAYVE